MDSNTITFNMLRPGSIRTTPSPQGAGFRVDDKDKYIVDESTNFVQYQDFKKASQSSRATNDDDSLSPQKANLLAAKKKIIHKPNKVLKLSQKHSKNQNFTNFNNVTSRTTVNQNYNNVKINAITKSKSTQQNLNLIKKTPTVKSHKFVSVFDWMMQVASILKVRRTVFYKSCNIFYQTYKIDSTILQNSKVEKYSCACLLIAAKFQNATPDYLEEMCIINKKRMTKQMLTATQISIYQTLNWKLPMVSMITEQISNVFQKWNNYLQKCFKMSIIRKERVDRLSLNLKYQQNQPAKNKTFGEILYLIDMIVLNQTKKYLNTVQLESITQQFMNPIIIAMYSVFTIQLGDLQNRQQFLLPLFKNFYRQEFQTKAIQIDRIQKQIQICFFYFNFAEHISKVPLNKDWKSVIEDDIQSYLPINVVKRSDLN